MLARLFPLYLVIFIGFLGYSLMITLFTPLLMTPELRFFPLSYSLEKRVVLLGILLSLYPLGQFFGSSILGALSDRYGRRKLLLITLVMGVIFYALIALALQRNDFPLLLIVSFLAGLMEANIALAQSAIADVTTERTRGRFFGYIYLSASFAYVVGPLVGGKVAASYSNASAFAIVTALLALVTVWVFFSFQETIQKQKKQLHLFDALSNLKRIFTSKHLRPFFLVNFLLYLSIFGFFRSYPMYLIDAFHLTVSKESEFIAWVAVPIILANLGLTSFFAKRFTSRTLTIVTGLLTGLFMLTVVLFSSLNSLWITLFLTALALALCLPYCASMLSLAATSKEQGSALGNNQALQVGAEAISSVLGGLLAAIFVKFALIVFSGFALLGALLLLFFKKNAKTPPLF